MWTKGKVIPCTGNMYSDKDRIGFVCGVTREEECYKCSFGENYDRFRTYVLNSYLYCRLSLADPLVMGILDKNNDQTNEIGEGGRCKCREG